MPFEFSQDGRVARIHLDAPPLNILTAELQAAVQIAIDSLNHDPAPTHNLLVIESQIEGVFSAGADVSEHIGRASVESLLHNAHGLIAALLESPVPTVCLVDGPCLGGAFELALACDQIVATERSTFGTPEIKLGCYPPAAMLLMPWKLPALLASELIQTGRVLGAPELERRGGIRIGRLDDIRPDAELPRGPLVEATRLLRGGRADWFRSEIAAVEAAYLERLLRIPDAAEGPAAFMEKRKPRWDHSMGGLG